METKQRQRMVAGLVLIGLGTGFFLLQRLDRIGFSALFLLIGGAFLTAYFYAKEFGYLVPGCILLGMGFGQIGRGTFLDFGNEMMIGLGAGFIGIFVISLLYERKSNWWALIPGGVLIVLGVPHTERVVDFLFKYWPAVLILVGLGILISAFVRPPRKSAG